MTVPNMYKCIIISSKEKLDSELVCTPYITTRNQLADILTKGLITYLFQDSTSKLGMKNIYSLAWVGVLENMHLYKNLAARKY